MGSYQRLVGDPDYGRLYRRRLRAVAARSLQRAAARYLRPRNLTLVVDTPDADEQLERQLREVVLRAYREEQAGLHQ
jgi:predicted Zn-dependent peptidase